MHVYATEADLLDWTGQAPPANAVGLLRAASSFVEDAAMLTTYRTNTDGTPYYGPTATAFMEATCAQAAFWAANDLDPAAGGLDEQGKRIASSKSIKGASVSYDAADAAAAKQARVHALTTLSHEAWMILRNAGLITAVVR